MSDLAMIRIDADVRQPLTKADLAAAQMAMLRSSAGDRRELDPAALLRMPALDRVAELLAREFTNEEIAEILGYADARVVNAQIQRIRRQLGPQAI